MAITYGAEVCVQSHYCRLAIADYQSEDNLKLRLLLRLQPESSVFY